MEEATEAEKTQSYSNPNDTIHARFSREREEWKDKVTSMSERLRDIYNLADLLTDVYSSRQIALEYTHTLMAHLSKVNRIFRVKKIERFNHYSRNYELRLDKDFKYDHIHADLNEIVERRELIQNHLDYFRETIHTIDNLTFGIKNRMALEEYRRG